MSFVATAAAVVHAGATPVFVDIEASDRPHMSLDEARRLITPRTRAIMVMHYGGFAVDLPAWRRLADEHGLLLFEDAAHVAGLAGATGTGSDAAAYSFFTNKNMTTAEGGMVVVADEARRERVRLLRSHGMTSEHAGPRPRPRGRLRRRGVRLQLPDGRAPGGTGLGADRAPPGVEPDARRAAWRATARLLEERLPEVCVSRSTPTTRPRATSCRSCLPERCDRTAIMASMRAARGADQRALPGHPPVHLLPATGSATCGSRTPKPSAVAS